jgi:predicted dehydrogenase
MNTQQANAAELSRRDFIRGGSVATLLGMFGAVEIKADNTGSGEVKKPTGPKVKLGIIGLGPRGREIIGTLQLQPEAEIASICDHYPAMLKRSAANVPGAKATADYKALLDDKEIKAVVIATPSHKHRDIAIEALKAGKHVYCEAPMATTLADARAIAAVARETVGQVFHPGLALRSDPQRHFLLQFVRSGASGHPLMARAQWNKKQSWRQASPNPEREKELNWRLDKNLSLGLAGEIGIHQIDMMSWLLKERPTAVTGFGGVLHWKEDGREVPDTAQFVFEYPGGVQGIFEASLANSFDADYEMLYGTYAAIMLRGNKAWMFKEVDSPLLGWEVYARKDVFYKETGIALVANATKLVAQGDNPVEDAPFANTALSFALEAFLSNVNEVSTTVEDFKDTYGTDDKSKLAKHLATINKAPAATWKEGLEAAVVAIKANEALMGGKRVTIGKELFDLS